VRTLQTEQLARDAGHMFARGADFSAVGNKMILANIGSSLNMSATTGSGTAVVILSAVTYVDSATCVSAGAVDLFGNPSGCNNLGKWVFTQRLTIGNPAVRASQIGSPTGVNLDSTGAIAPIDYVTKTGARTTFSSINAYSNVGGNVSGLPSAQILYIAEASAPQYTIQPYASGSTYAFGLF